MQTLPTLSQGATGEDVKTLQRLLGGRVGVPAPAVDGAFGPATGIALKAFQRTAGFTGADVDGMTGPKTWPKLLNR